MADLQSTTYAAQVAAEASAGDMIADSNLLSGRLRVLQGAWTIPAGTGADTLYLVYLPANATLIPGATVTVDSAAGANTVGVGFSGDLTGIAAAVSLNTAGTALLPMKTGSIVNTTRRAILVTLSGALTAAKNIWFTFLFSAGE